MEAKAIRSLCNGNSILTRNGERFVWWSGWGRDGAFSSLAVA